MNVNTLASQLKEAVSAAPDDERARYLAIAAGYVAGYSAPVFADKDGLTAEAVFVRDHQRKLTTALGKLNNVIVIGLSDAIEVAKQVWCTRYRLVHEATSPDAMTLLGCILREQTSYGLDNFVELTNPATVMELVQILSLGYQEEE